MKKNKSTNCPFCDSAITSTVFMASLNFYVIYNHAPILPGHSLVIPKSHIESLFDLSETEQSELIQLSTLAARSILKVFNADSFNLTIQEKPAAGQTVKHLHLHIIPRHDNDLPKPGDWYPVLKAAEKNNYIDSENRFQLSHSELLKIVQNIKAQL